MATINDITFIDTLAAAPVSVASGIERTICSAGLCGSKNLIAYRRTISAGRSLSVQAGDDYHLLYVIEGAADGQIRFGGSSHTAEEGAGVLLVPGESVSIDAQGSSLDVLHLVTPKPPAAVENGLPGGPGYFFNRGTLRALADSSGGRVRRFCVESSVRYPDGRRLTQTNAIQAGEMHYNAGGASPYHLHKPTEANPDGAAHCYITFKGRGKVDVGQSSQVIEPGTLVYFPSGIPHQLNAWEGALDYFEIQAWRSFKTDILSNDPLGLKWFYVGENPDEPKVEWNQS